MREQIVVEGLQIERTAFLRLVLYEQRLDLRLADGIVERLPRTKRKTAHFSLRRRAIDAGIRFEPCNRALEAPFSGCEFRIDDSASAAQPLELRDGVAPVEIVTVKAVTFEQCFFIKRPAFGEDAVEREAAHRIGIVFGDRELQEVPWEAFVSAGHQNAIAIEVFEDCARCRGLGHLGIGRRNEIDAVDLL